MKKIIVFAGLLCLLTGCMQSRDSLPNQPAIDHSSSTNRSDVPSNLPPQTEEEPVIPYINQLVKDTAAKITTPQMNDMEKIKAAYEYIIANTQFAPPVGLDIWRVRGANDPLPTYLENHTLSVLAFGIGSCEDYAAALTLLLQEMGFEARYVPGLTLSVNGEFVDHAWTAVKMGNGWYHLDSQLEDNVIQQDLLTYRFFMKSDSEMAGHHLWGEQLINYAHDLSDAQITEIRGEYALPPCKEGISLPPSKKLEQVRPVDRAKVYKDLHDEVVTYEATHGKLPPVTLNLTPPVFGDEGYGPPD